MKSYMEVWLTQDQFQMIDQSSQPGASDEPTEAFAKIPSTVAEGFCPVCNYDLQGLVASGDCPECGEHYEMDMLLPRLFPGLFSICLRFLWPLAILVVLGIVYFSAYRSNPNVQDAGLIYSMNVIWIGVLNGIVQGKLLVRRHCAVRDKDLRLDEQLSGIGPVAIGLFYLSIASGIFGAGGMLLFK